MFRDVSTNNILQGIEDISVLRQIEEDELTRPVARKILDGRQIYFSRPVPVSAGLPVLSDFGEARIGKAMQTGDIMPGIYRAPEVILGMEWDNKVDIWSTAVMVSGSALGHTQNIPSDESRLGIWLLEVIFFSQKKGGALNDEQHLAEMVSLIGPPPPEFLRRSSTSLRYWDSQGLSPRFLCVYTDLTRIQAIGKAPCVYRSNHWKCEHSSILVMIKSSFWVF